MLFCYYVLTTTTATTLTLRLLGGLVHEQAIHFRVDVRVDEFHFMVLSNALVSETKALNRQVPIVIHTVSCAAV